MKNILMQVETTEITDEDKRIYIGDSGVFESRFTTPGEVYKDSLSEYGRCVGKCYVGNENPKQIGWVFRKRVKYSDSNDTYLQETWVTLHEAPAKRVIEYSPMYLD